MSIQYSSAQNINWSLQKNNAKYTAYSSFGFDHGATTQIGFGKYLETTKPIFIMADFSLPMGNQLVDDFKTRVGIQLPLLKANNFILTAKIQAIMRRHETKLVRMFNFGSDTNIAVGYYKKSWHIAGEIGFDKSINTHLKHSKAMQENYPGISDGWFLPSGGHYYLGLQTGKYVSTQFEINMRMGITNAQFEDQNSLLPFYCQLGVNYTVFKK